MNNGKYDLANTNKLIRFYPGANGLKTGSTSKALCCLSASAIRDDMQLVAVVLAAPTSNERFADARALLDFGFANYCVQKPVTKGDEISVVTVKKGVKEEVGAVSKDTFSYLCKKSEKGDIEQEIYLPDEIKAPVAKGQSIGKVVFSCGGKTIGEVELISAENIEKKGFSEYLKEIFQRLFK